MKKTFIVLAVAYLSIMVCAKDYMNLSLSSNLTGEQIIATVSDKNTGTPLENVGLEVFQGAVLPTTRVFYDYTNGEGETEPFIIDEPGTYIITITRGGYFYDEIPVEFTSALPEYPGIWLPACLLFIPFIVLFFTRFRKRV
ncbi:MAG: hypothetical protein U9M95_06560 [Candidatus Altiarchaeota archaeon]|nr:hypothetical protein [Candidatus Altiarchaeota archaeon]